MEIIGQTKAKNILNWYLLQCCQIWLGSLTTTVHPSTPQYIHGICSSILYSSLVHFRYKRLFIAIQKLFSVTGRQAMRGGGGGLWRLSERLPRMECRQWARRVRSQCCSPCTRRWPRSPPPQSHRWAERRTRPGPRTCRAGRLTRLGTGSSSQSSQHSQADLRSRYRRKHQGQLQCSWNTTILIISWVGL